MIRDHTERSQVQVGFDISHFQNPLTIPSLAQTIALGGMIGTVLFLGSVQILARGGPVCILGTYSLMPLLVFCAVAGIYEVAAYLSTLGSSMNVFGYRCVSRSMRFGLGRL